MRKIVSLIILLAIAVNCIAGGTKTMETFGQKSLEIDDNWSLKEVGYKDSKLVTFFRKNIGASEISSHKKLSNLIYFTIFYNPANEQGFPSDEDYKKISDFENIVIPKIEFESDSIHVASVLKNGIYDFLFYVSNPDKFIESTNKHNSEIKAFKVEIELINDPKWEIYHDFP